MGKNTVDIIFSDGRGICLPGNILDGSVKLTVGNPIKVKEIFLKCRGEANVSFQEGNTVYYSKEKYFEKTIKLVQKQEGQNEDITFQEGVYNYPFSIRLPEGIPSSYQGVHGSIRYEVEVNVVRPWTFNLSRISPYTVISVLNLNDLPDVSKQMVATDEKTVCCLCCASGQITATITTERQGYVPGEEIKFWAEIRNDSSRNIKYSKAKFIMRVVYHSGTKTMTINHVLHKLRGQGIPPRGTYAWSGQKLFISPLPPSFLLGCRIIKIHYFVSITVVLSGPALDLVVPVEVIIGTTPILKEGQALPQPDFKGNVLIKENVYTRDAFAPLYHFYHLDRPHPSTNFDIAH